jgi:RNA-directed DNA polymerase
LEPPPSVTEQRQVFFYAERRRLADRLAHYLLAGPWTEAGLTASLAALLARRAPSSQRRLIELLLAAPENPYPPAARAIREAILDWAGHRLLLTAIKRAGRLDQPVTTPPWLSPVELLASPVLVHLSSPGDLARWLGLTPEQLDWYADSNRQNARAEHPEMMHYDCVWRPKAAGGYRLLEVPKPRLMALQRRILRAVLDPLPPHPAAHGFVAGRSCLTHAAHHAGEACVVRLDLADFFPSTPLRRVHAIFRCVGAPPSVARLLTGLCSAQAPSSVLRRLAPRDQPSHAAWSHYGNPHLPQGAPTSPALANLCAYRLDVRLAGLARSRGLRYSRYADDLTFSGDAALEPGAGRLIAAVAQIAGDEGYAVHPGKTRVMPARGQQRVTGLVVNAGLNIARADFDALKAILTNCVRHGPAGQDRSNHADFRAVLNGRVSWVEQVHGGRGAKLRALFEQIEWATNA